MPRHNTVLRVSQASNGSGRSMPAPLELGLRDAPGSILGQSGSGMVAMHLGKLPSPSVWDEPGFVNGTLIDDARHQVLIAECEANVERRYPGRDFSKLSDGRITFWSDIAGANLHRCAVCGSPNRSFVCGRCARPGATS